MHITTLNERTVSSGPGRMPPRSREHSLREILLAALFLALATGLAEAAILSFRKIVLGEAIHLSQHYLWMAPVGYVVMFALPALTLGLISRRWRQVRIGHVVGVLAFLSVLGVLFMFPRLHRIAMFVLAAGAGIQAARMVESHRAGFTRLVRRSVGVLGGVVLALAILVTGALHLGERRKLAALPDAPDAAPNVLLIILDTVRAASLGLYGYDRPTTPNLERIAERGVVFDRALSPSPWTLPAHGTFFTGRYPHELTANWRTPLDDTYPTLAELLAERGYETAGFVANSFYTTYEHGLDRGFVHYEDYVVSLGQILNSASLGALVFAGRPGFSNNLFRRVLDNYEYFGRKKADHLSSDFLDWVGDGRPRPFFAFLNYIDAHAPFTPPADYAARFGVRGPRPLLHRITNDKSTLTEEERAAGDYDRNRYDASIAFLDHELGRMFDELERRGVLDNTLVIVTSDHGELLGEMGIYAHANSLYMELLHVPLLIAFPGRVPTGGNRIGEVVTLRSIPATILALTGASDERRIPGGSLSGLWQPEGASPADPLLASVRKGINVREDLPIARGDLHALTHAERHYIRNPDGSEELYDISQTMTQDSALAPAAGAEALLAPVRARLENLIGAAAMRPVPDSPD
ncbi:MAG: sulfatase [Gemmatimonadaceae bacterium]